jgi:hypothetical protein
MTHRDARRLLIAYLALLGLGLVVCCIGQNEGREPAPRESVK